MLTTEDTRHMSFIKKRGTGGFLNGESGAIVGTKLDSTTFGEGEDAYTKLSLEISVLRDGADEPVSQFLDAGFLPEELTVSEDGLSLEGDKDFTVFEDTDLGRFLQTAIEQGFPEAEMDASGKSYTYLAGRRYTFAKEINKERQLAAGRKKLGAKAKSATEEEIMKAGKRQDRNDKSKFYNHDRLIVQAYLGVAEGVAAPAKGGAKKGAAPKKGAANKPAASAPVAPAAEASDLTEQAQSMLLTIVANKGNKVAKAALSGAIVTQAMADGLDSTVRDQLRTIIVSDDFLQSQAGWKFDGKMVTL